MFHFLFLTSLGIMKNTSFLVADFILVLLFHNRCSLSMQSPNITTDHLALLAFKAHVHHPQNLLAANWSTSTSVCNWVGVSCGHKHQRVTVLKLSSMNLTGTLSPDLGNLSFLSWLDIENNSFLGSIPAELANLRRLTYISFAKNNLTGEIPSWFDSLPKLESLYLHENYFTDAIPSSLCYLPKLEALDLHKNNLKGQIPEEIGNLPSLKVLYLQNNQLSGSIPSSIFNISSLQEVELKSNYLSGSIPTIPFNMSSLQVVDFGFNNLTGQLPYDMFDHLPLLREIFLDRNQFSGGIPSSLFRHEQLQVLFLSHNQFEGSLPEGLGNLTMLKILFASGNHFRGEIPKQIGNLIGTLEMLSFGDNQLKGSVPSFIGNFSLLTNLDLSSNNFAGTIPHEIGNLNKLDTLYLVDNKLYGTIPSAIFNSSTMMFLSLQTNSLSGRLPPSLWLPQVEYFYLGENKLGGQIPSSLSNSSNLISIELQSNFFSGYIPDTFGSLIFLQELNLGKNNFSIELSLQEMSFISSLTNCRYLQFLYIDENPLVDTKLPVSIGNLSSSLEVFSATGCNIRGSVPAEIGNLSSLISLKLDNNKLTGTIPTSVGRMRELQWFSLQGNELEASIPVDICNLESLSFLDLTSNKLSGPIPPCLGNLSSLRSLFLGSNRFTSSIPLTLTRLEDILHLNLSSNSLTGHLPIDIGKWKVVIEMDLSENHLSGKVPVSIGDLKGITHLSLSNNNLQGSIPQSIGDMIDLLFLDLSRNNLSGTIPNSLEKLWNLNYFNVSFNKLEGEVPTGGAFSSYSIQSFMGNQALCGTARLHLSPCKTNSHGRSRKTPKLLEYILPTLVATIIIILAFVIIISRSRNRKTSLPTHGDIIPLATWRRISYYELQQATDGFCESNLLGIGSFGSVYQGTLPNGTSIAVKVFKLELETAFKSFEIECEVLRSIRHRNLVKIISTCCNIDFKALVLEFMTNGSLEKWLYSHNHFLNILQRLNIMLDVASALEYLHHGHTTSVVHCDLKPSNVLLDQEMCAHLGDFGIAKLLGEEDLVVQTMTLATIGYMAPEYGAEGIISIKGDVYSFGILLMETFSRKKPTDEMFSGDMSLKQWVEQSLPSEVIKVTDKNLLSSTERENLPVKDCALSILQLGGECSADLSDERIDMKKVVDKLKKIKIKFLNDIERAR